MMFVDIIFMFWIDYLYEVGELIWGECGKLLCLVKCVVMFECDVFVLCQEVVCGQVVLFMKVMQSWMLVEIQVVCEKVCNFDLMNGVMSVQVDDSVLCECVYVFDGWYMVGEVLQIFDQVGVLCQYNLLSMVIELECMQMFVCVLVWWNYVGCLVCEWLVVKQSVF